MTPRYSPLRSALLGACLLLGASLTVHAQSPAAEEQRLRDMLVQSAGFAGSWIPADTGVGAGLPHVELAVTATGGSTFAFKLSSRGQAVATAELSPIENGWYRGRWQAAHDPRLNGVLLALLLPDGDLGLTGPPRSSSDPARAEESDLYLSRYVGPGRFKRGSVTHVPQPQPAPGPPGGSPPPAGPAAPTAFKPLRRFDVRLDRLVEARGYPTRQVHAFVTLKNASAQPQYITSGVLKAVLTDADGVAQERSQVWRASAEPAALFSSTPVVQPGAELKIRYVFIPDEGAQPATFVLSEGDKRAEFTANF